ncbi:MAG: hypothetical protein IJQ35_08545, partial [Bacteroidales bacterium]|nr:hypothetical protein [Bacteroidales bacterium]
MELQFPFYYNISIFLQSTASDFRQPQLTLPGRGSYNWLKSNGFRIYGAVIDGMKGLAKALYPLPVQLCQFHQMLTVRHYLTQ